MTEKRNLSAGGPAFPVSEQTVVGEGQGLSVKEMFFLAALQGCAANPDLTGQSPDGLAMRAKRIGEAGLDQMRRAR